MNLIGDSFVFHGSIYPKVKFWGKSVEFKPQGVCTLKFPEWEDEAFTWSNGQVSQPLSKLYTVPPSPPENFTITSQKEKVRE